MHALRIQAVIILLVTIRWCHAALEPCPSSCYCDLPSRYIHCQGPDPPSLAALQRPNTLRLELRDLRGPTLPRLPSSLLELSVRSSQVTTLTNTTLLTLSQLTTLDLSHNQLAEVETGAFDPLTSLRHLDLGWNSITAIQGCFTQLSNLETLDLSHNNVKELSSKTFQGLQRLQWLDVSHNKISQIETGTFLPTPSLERVTLGGNPMASLRRLEFLGARLRYMDVTAMELYWAPESLGTSVRELRAAHNSLEILRRGDLESYPSLALLDLSSNKLKLIEDDALGRLEFLIRVWLSDNELEHIPKSLPRSLKELFMDQNSIETVTQADLQGLPRLQKLILSQNHLTTISSEVLSLVPSLKYLTLASNLLSSATFGPNLLQELDLSDNQGLVLKPSSFSSVPQLQVLHLCNLTRDLGPDLKVLLTPLANLDTLTLSSSPVLAAQALTSQVWYGLNEMDFMGANLTSLPAQLFAEPGKLRTLNLARNPWNCSDQEAIARMLATRPRVTDLNMLKCRYPDNLRGAALKGQIATIPSQAPTRVQIQPPTAPNVTGKPQMTAPLTHNAPGHNNVTSQPITPTDNQQKIAVQLPSAIPILNDDITTSTTNIVNENTIQPTVTAKENTTPDAATKIIPSSAPASNPQQTTKMPELPSTPDVKTEITPTQIAQMEKITQVNPVILATNVPQVITTATPEVEKLVISVKIEEINEDISVEVTSTPSTVTSITPTPSPTLSPSAGSTLAPSSPSESTVPPPERSPVTTTELPFVDYEELTSIIEEEEFYPAAGGNFSDLHPAALSSEPEGVSPSTLPVGFLGVLGVCALGAVLLGALQWCRRSRYPAPRDPELHTLDILLGCEQDRPRW